MGHGALFLSRVSCFSSSFLPLFSLSCELKHRRVVGTLALDIHKKDPKLGRGLGEIMSSFLWSWFRYRYRVSPSVGLKLAYV
jgi:hypothetical protein